MTAGPNVLLKQIPVALLQRPARRPENVGVLAIVILELGLSDVERQYFALTL
jgi:hypothetical protein